MNYPDRRRTNPPYPPPGQKEFHRICLRTSGWPMLEALHCPSANPRSGPLPSSCLPTPRQETGVNAAGGGSSKHPAHGKFLRPVAALGAGGLCASTSGKCVRKAWEGREPGHTSDRILYADTICYPTYRKDRLEEALFVPDVHPMSSDRGITPAHPQRRLRRSHDTKGDSSCNYC